MKNVSVKATAERKSKLGELEAAGSFCLIFEKILLSNVFEKCSKIDVLGMFFNVLGITLIAHIIENYLYIYLYILSIFIIYIIYNTIYTINRNIVYITLLKKINFISIIYITVSLIVFCIIEVEQPSKYCSCSVFYSTKKHLSVDIRSRILTNNKEKETC